MPHAQVNCMSNSNALSCAACGDGSNHPASCPICSTFIAKQKALLQCFPENMMPYYPTKERWTWVQNPTNLERPSSPPLWDQPQSGHYEHQNLTHYQQYPNQQTNRCTTDTYIPNNSWPQSRCQFMLNEVWGPWSNWTPASSSQPSHSQKNASTHQTSNTQ